jgi:hypothetical protein
MNKVFGGTVNYSGENLCYTCSCGQHMKGSLVNEDVVLCHTRGTSPPIRITWKVTSCNDYEDARTPELWEMEKIAWKISADGKRRFVGFLSPKQWKEKGMDPDD